MTRLTDVSILDIANILGLMQLDCCKVTTATALVYVGFAFPDASSSTRTAIAVRVLRLYAEQVFRAARDARRA